MVLLSNFEASNIQFRVMKRKLLQSLPLLFGMSFEFPIMSTHADSNNLTPISSQSSQNQYTTYSQGMTNLINGNFDKAINLFDESLSMDGSVADVYIARGIAYEKVGRWNDAISDYREANAIYKRKNMFSRDDPVAISNIANAETGLDKWNDALKDFTYSASLKPDYLAPQIGRAFALYQLDKKDEALIYFRSLVAKYPSFADGNAALAVMLYEKGESKDIVMEAWEEALEADSRYLDVDWVRDIRRWPPKLVDTLITFKSQIALQK